MILGSGAKVLIENKDDEIHTQGIIGTKGVWRTGYINSCDSYLRSISRLQSTNSWRIYGGNAKYVYSMAGFKGWPKERNPRIVDVTIYILEHHDFGPDYVG